MVLGQYCKCSSESERVCSSLWIEMEKSTLAKPLSTCHVPEAVLTALSKKTNHPLLELLLV